MKQNMVLLSGGVRSRAKVRMRTKLLRAVAVIILFTSLAAMTLNGQVRIYPEFVADHIVVVDTIPVFRTVLREPMTYTWLDLPEAAGTPALVWERRGDPHLRAGATRPFLAERLTLAPSTRYTFELFIAWPCDTVNIKYPYQAGDTYLLRVLQGSKVLFDAKAAFARKDRGGSYPPGVAPAAADPGVVEPMAGLLRRWIASGARDGFGAEVQKESRALGRAGAGAIPAVLCDQPLNEAELAVLVYDPGARGRGRVRVSACEGTCPDDLRSINPPALLREVGGGSGVFVGRAPVEGSHGTFVQVRYKRAGTGKKNSTMYAAETTSMGFH
jgi:hypothetical protein